MLCTNCGYNNQPNNRFCVRCGIDIGAPPAPDTPSFDVAAPAPGTPAPGTPTPVPPDSPAPTQTASAAGAPPNPWGAPHAPQGAPPGPAGWPPPGSGPVGPTPGPMPPPNPFAPPPPIAAPGAYPPPGAYGQYPAYPPPGGAPGATNGLAIAALVLGIVGWIPCGVGSLVAVVLGFIARTQIRDARGRQGGDGLAVAGIILGFIGIGLWLLFVILSVTLGTSNTS